MLQEIFDRFAGAKSPPFLLVQHQQQATSSRVSSIDGTLSAMNEGAELVEWRFFLPATEHLDPASIEAVEAFDTLAAGVIPAEPERRCDVYVTCDETCGIKHRGKSKLEIKLRGSKHQDEGGISENYTKTKFGKGATLAMAAQHLQEKGLLTENLAARLQDPVHVTTEKEVRKGERPAPSGPLVLEKTGLVVSRGQPPHDLPGAKWLTFSVEGARDDVCHFIRAEGRTLQHLVKHDKAVVGGYPTFVQHIAR